MVASKDETNAELRNQIEALKAGWINEAARRVAYENNMQMCECESYAKCQAREQLHAEHPELFGSGEQVGTGVFLMHRPVPMLTNEQRAALAIALKHIPNWPDAKAECNARDELRSLLSSASPAWEVTEERKAALDVAIRDLEKIGKSLEGHTARVLRAMLDEVTK